MSGSFKSTFRKGQRARLSRALTYVLLFLVSYGYVVGIAHRHDGLSILASTVSSPSSSQVAVGAPDSSAKGPVNSHECEICQFRQSLSNGAIYAPSAVRAQTNSVAAFLIVASPVYFTVRTTSQGRAPPVTS